MFIFCFEMIIHTTEMHFVGHLTGLLVVNGLRIYMSYWPIMKMIIMQP